MSPLVTNVIAWALVAFFMLGGAVNVLGPQPLRDELTEWGFPAWFRFLIALSHWASALLIANTAWRGYGMALAAFVCVAALATLIHHRQYRKTPLAMVLLSLIVAWWTIQV